jgi:DNA-binding response OmpR family regulator
MATILLVEEKARLRALFRQALEEKGHNVCEATGGKEALSRCHSYPRDTVIMDLPLPDGDGLATIHTLRQNYPSLNIVALSGEDYANKMLRRARAYGANRTFVKPVAMDELLTAVQRLSTKPIPEPIPPDAA